MRHFSVFSASKWNRFFKSRFLAVFNRQAQIYFYLALGVLTIFLLESIREIQKYSSMGELDLTVEIFHLILELIFLLIIDRLVEEDTTLNMGLQHQLRLFRAQRNFYICGFSMFLSLVIRRLVTLISAQATLIANSEASMKQAQSATAAARTMMNSKGDEGGDDEEKKALQQQVKLLKDELVKEQKDKEAMKSQSESLNREYDRLTAEYSKLQNKVEKTAGKSE